MDAAQPTERLHRMFDRSVPQGGDVWTWLRAVEFIAPQRSYLVASVMRLKRHPVVPVFKLMEELSDHSYRIILTRAQLERVIAEHYYPSE